MRGPAERPAPGHSPIMGLIDFANTSVTYPGGLTALKDVTLSIGEGEFVVIVGLSGAGKSTMLRAINGLVPVSGSVLVDGREVVGASSSELRAIRSDVGMIFQTFNLVNRSRVINNALMGRLSKIPPLAHLLRPMAVRGQGDRARVTRTGRHRREGLRACLRPLRRPATTRRNRSRSGPGAQDHSRRRAGRLTRSGDVAHGDARSPAHQP